MNELIIGQFRLLAKQVEYEIDMVNKNKKMENMYRLSSINKVIKILENFKDKITSSSQLKNIKNVGKKSLERIDEILKNKKLKEIYIDNNKFKYLSIIDKLDDVIGIGRKKAFDYFKNHNVKSIDDLKKLDLPDNIKKGLKYFDKIVSSIDRSEIDEMVNILSNATINIDSGLFGMICGSYRREQLKSSDIDFVITHKNIKSKDDLSKYNYLEKLVKYLKKKKIIIDSLTSDDVTTKYMGILDGYRRIDIRCVPYNSFYSAILYFTGSKDFNRKMRMIANELGYTLSEYGLFDNTKSNKPFVINSEKDIFDLLNMSYVKPSLRNV